MKMKDQLDELNKEFAEFARSNNIEKLQEIRDKYAALLNYAPEDPALIFPLATCTMQLGFNGEAIQLFKRVIYYTDKYPEAWNNLGAAWRNENRSEEAKYCFKQALVRRKDADFYNNLSTLYINEGNPKPGIDYAMSAIEINFNHYQAHWNLALLLLEDGQWKKGLTEYEFGLLTCDRPPREYSNNPSDIPTWEGQKDKTVVVYGEQGIGDEIMFSSCLPDVMRDCKKVIIDCHPRLVGVMERSFPDAIVYGTRKKNGIDWPENHNIDYSRWLINENVP